MKTLKSMLAGFIILFASVAANAAVKSNQPSQTDVVNVYINAITTGKTSDVDNLLDNELQFNVHLGGNTSTLDKNQVIDYLKDNTVLSAPLSTNVTVMQQDDESAKLKVEFKYADYTRTDVVTLNKVFGWKITSVDSTSK